MGGSLGTILCCLLTAQVADDGQPTSFRVTFTHDGPIFSGVPVTARLTALDREGQPLESFAGFVRVEGVLQAAGGVWSAVDRAGPFSRGSLLLERIRVPDGKLSVRLEDGETSSSASRRRLPGFLTLLPPLAAIGLAILTRQVLLSLFCGVWVGALLLHGFDPLAAFLRAGDRYLVTALADPGHASILLFSLSLAGMVGVITATGGIRGIVEAVSRRATGRRSGQLATWGMGVVIFFDDYANSLIVGNTMRPFTDRVRISREKLSFIVDATAAPVATIGVISTWTAYQLGLVENVLPQTTAAIREPYLFFLASIPFSFYSFFMLLLVFLVGLSLRDFGPMRAAEKRCAETGAVLRPGAEPLVDDSLDGMAPTGEGSGRWYNAAVPIGCVIVFTAVGLYATGLAALSEAEAESAGLRDIISRADSYRALLWAALGASVVAGALGLCQGWKLQKLIVSWVTGARALTLAAMILLLAWSINAVCLELQTGAYVMTITQGVLSPVALPALTFIIAAAIAFSTGTSYGTMGILIPMLLPLAYQLAAADGPETADTVGLATLSAILGGSVFGDHCSPISDTTVLSSMASGADHVDHVRTQLPYALLVAAICVPCYLLAGLAWHPLLLLAIGAVVLLVAFWFLSRARIE